MARDKQPRRGQHGRIRLDWLAPALLHPRLTEIEIDDVVQTLAAHGSGHVTEDQIRAVIARRVGVSPRQEDVQQVKALLGTRWQLV